MSFAESVGLMPFAILQVAGMPQSSRRVREILADFGGNFSVDQWWGKNRLENKTACYAELSTTVLRVDVSREADFKKACNLETMPLQAF